MDDLIYFASTEGLVEMFNDFSQEKGFGLKLDDQEGFKIHMSHPLGKTCLIMPLITFREEVLACYSFHDGLDRFLISLLKKWMFRCEAIDEERRIIFLAQGSGLELFFNESIVELRSDTTRCTIPAWRWKSQIIECLDNGYTEDGAYKDLIRFWMRLCDAEYPCAFFSLL